MKKLNGSHFLTVFLLGTLLWVWFSMHEGLIEKTSTEKENLKTKEATVVKRDIPVMVETVKPPPPKKRTVKKKRIVKKVSRKKANNKAKGKAEFTPNLFATYEMPVNEYLTHMRQRGAIVLVFEKETARFVCEIMDNGILKATSGPDNVSSHLRRLTDDFPQGRNILRKVDEFFGTGNYEILLFIPEHIERLFAENIERILIGQGLDIQDVSTVFMSYNGNTSILSVHIDKVSGHFGTRVIRENFKL